MLNNPNKLKGIAVLTMALVFWLSGTSLFAQNKQTNPTEPQKVVPSRPKESLSNQEPSSKKQQDKAALEKQAKAQQLKENQGIEAKKKSMEKMNASEPKHSKQVHNTSADAPAKQAMAKPETSEKSTSGIQKDWEIKKSKIAADLKAKGYSQYDIDKKISVMEKEMNINNNSNK